MTKKDEILECDKLLKQLEQQYWMVIGKRQYLESILEKEKNTKKESVK